MHSMSSTIGSVAAILAFFIISKRLEQDTLWRSYRYFSIEIAFVVIVVSVVGVGTSWCVRSPRISAKALHGGAVLMDRSDGDPTPPDFGVDVGTGAHVSTGSHVLGLGFGLIIRARR